MNIDAYLSTIKNCCVLDIGANVGGTIDMFASNGCEVFAFEPNVNLYNENLKGKECDKIHVFNKAMSNKVGFTKFYLGSEVQAATIIKEMSNETRLGSNLHEYEVETETIDNFCESNNIKPDFIKIDVEGAEHLVIEGGENVIQKYLPTIVFECGFGTNVHETSKQPYLYKDLVAPHIKFLDELNYALYIIDVFFSQGENFYSDNPSQLIKFHINRIPDCNWLGVNFLALPCI